MKYGNAYMTEKRKAHGAVVDGFTSSNQRKSGSIGRFRLAWGYVGF